MLIIVAQHNEHIDVFTENSVFMYTMSA